MANFAIWQHDTLVRFAREASEKLNAQAREIAHLEILLKQATDSRDALPEADGDL